MSDRRQRDRRVSSIAVDVERRVGQNRGTKLDRRFAVDPIFARAHKREGDNRG